MAPAINTALSDGRSRSGPIEYPAITLPSWAYFFTAFVCDETSCFHSRLVEHLNSGCEWSPFLFVRRQPAQQNVIFFRIKSFYLKKKQFEMQWFLCCRNVSSQKPVLSEFCAFFLPNEFNEILSSNVYELVSDKFNTKNVCHAAFNSRCMRIHQEMVRRTQICCHDFLRRLLIFFLSYDWIGHRERDAKIRKCTEPLLRVGCDGYVHLPWAHQIVGGKKKTKRENKMLLRAFSCVVRLMAARHNCPRSHEHHHHHLFLILFLSLI